MAKRFTPIIGLAVVVALAMVAVFGAMSLTNPAFAAVGAPADAELAERTISPQAAAAETAVVLGEDLEYDIDSIIRGGGATFKIATVTCVPSCDSGTNPIRNDNPEVVFGYNALNLTAPAANVLGIGSVRMTVTVEFTDDTENQVFVVLVNVTPEVHETATVIKAIPDQEVTIRTSLGSGAASDIVSTKIDLADYFKDGRGDAKIATYMASESDTTKLTFAPNVDGLLTVATDGTELEMFASDTQTAGYVAVTVTTTKTTPPSPDLDPSPSITFFVNVVAAGTGTGPGAPGGQPSFSYLSADPGKNTRYELRFPAPKNMNTLTDEIVIELEDFTVPSSIDEDSIAVTVDGGCVTIATPPLPKDCTTTPQDIAVSGEKIFITVGDLDKASDDTANDFSIRVNEVIAVVIRQSAGIKNPTEAGDYGPVAEVLFGNNEELPVADFDGVDELTIAVPRILSLDEEDGGLGTVVNATGKGFKNSTSLTVFVDKPVHMDDDNDPTTAMSDDDGVAGEDTMMPNRQLDLGEDTLCEVSKIGGDDVGICEFTVTHPTFSGGINYINAVDGRNGYISDGEDLGEFELTASISASPAGGSPGEIILLQMVDFPVGPVVMVQLSRTEVCGPSNTTPTCNGSVDLTGSGNFKITIPNWAKSGSQELRVTGQNDAAGEIPSGAPRTWSSADRRFR